MVENPGQRPIRSLPPERAFVVQLEAETDLSAEEVGGRVEHVVSGRAVRFQSLAQLLAFLRRILGTTAHEEEGHPPRPGTSEKAGADE
jgi:hypothetical protein